MIIKRMYSRNDIIRASFLISTNQAHKNVRNTKIIIFCKGNPDKS